MRPPTLALHEAAIMLLSCYDESSGILSKEMEMTKNLETVSFYRRFLFVDSGFD